MKRHGNLMPLIAEPENVRLAFWKASRGKRGKVEVIEFRERFEENIALLSTGLSNGSVSVGNYHYFTIHDPKERRICAADFTERVLHHAIMNICEPILETAAIANSCACRGGRAN